MEEDKLKLQRIDEQLAGLLEERFEIFRRIHKVDEQDLLKQLQESKEVDDTIKNKLVNSFFNLVFKEFEKIAQKYKVTSIVASGPVIIEDGKLLVNKDEKDDFYKIPGGTVEPDTEDLEQACHRETKEENNAEIEIIKPLHPMIIWKNPQTDEKMAILLIHYLAKLKNPNELRPIPPIKEVTWLPISEIREGKHDVSPNIKFLIDKGDIS